MKRLRFGYVLLLLLLAACGGTYNHDLTSCTTYTTLQQQIDQPFTPDEFTSWVTAQYGSSSSPVVTRVDEQQSTLKLLISWEADGYQYSAVLEKGKLVQIAIRRNGRARLEADEITACLGSPQAYYALHRACIEGGSEEFFRLFFLSEGVLAIGYRHYDSYVTRPIQGNFPIDTIFVLRPGDLSEILVQVYGRTDPYEYGQVRVWPGRWKDIIIDVTPSMQRIQQMQQP